MIKNFSSTSFIAGVMVGVLIAGAWAFGAQSMLISAPLQRSSPNAIDALPQSGAVAVSAQKAGVEVLVDSVTVPPPGVWVAVREVVGSGLGNVLGAVRLNGPHSNVSVPLLRATEANRSYVVELYRDDNNGEFDPGVNSVYVDFTTGARVVNYFKTTD